MTVIVTPTTKKRRNIIVIMAVAIAVLAVVALILSRAGFDKTLVKQKIDAYIALVHERGLARGRDITITYSDIALEGNFTSRHAVIQNVVLNVKPSKPEPLKPGQPAKQDALTVTTPEVVIVPTSMDLSSFRLSLPQPVNFAATDAPEKSLLKIASNVPFDVAVATTNKNRVPYVVIDHTAPGSLDFTYLREQQVQGKEEATPSVVPVYDTLHVAITPGSTIHLDMATDGSNLGTALIDIKQITMAPQSAPEAVMTIAAINAKWSDVVDAKQQNTITAAANLGPLTGPADLMPNAPFQFVMDGSYSAAPKVTATATASATVGTTPDVQPQSTIAIRKFALTTRDASVNAVGDFTSTVGDVLPVGKLSLNIVNVPFIRTQLQNNGAITADNAEWVNGVVQQITGTPFDQLKDVTIPIERVRNGAFKIGNSTFEELIAVVLKKIMQQHTGVTPMAVPMAEPGVSLHAPVLPAADKPKAAPIAVPDNGVRG